MNNKSFTKRDIIVLCVALSFFAVILCLNFFSFGRYLDSDMYGDMYVSKLMWEQKTFFPENWVFGNQIYILATPNIAAFLYGLTGSLMYSTIIASIVMIAIMLYAFWYCFTACFDKKTVLIGYMAFFGCFVTTCLPDNEFGQLFFTGTTFYSCYVITLLIALGCYLRALKEDNIKKIIMPLVIASVLSLIMGIQSLRQTLIMALPILVHQVFYLIYYLVKKLKINKSALIVTVSLFISNMAGVFISKIISVPREEIIGGLGFSPLADIKGKILSVPYYFTSLFGVRSIASKYLNGQSIGILDILSFLCGLALIAFVIIFVIYLIKKRPFKNTVAANALVVLLFGVLGTVAVFFTVDISRLAKYLFVFFLLIPASVMFFYETLGENGKKRLLSFVVPVCVVVLITAYVSPLVSTFTDKTDYDRIAEYMQDNNYDIVYTVWNNAGPIAAASDFNVLAGRWDASQVFKIKTHTNILDIYSEEDNEKACYMFTDDTLNDAKEYLGKDFSVLHLVKEFHGDGENKYLYTSDKQLMYN